MSAVLFRTHGSEHVLEFVRLQRPTPGPGTVRVRVHACGVNRLDLEIREGVSRLDHPWPHVLGREIAGVVDAVGPGVQSSLVGARVSVAPIIPCSRCTACVAGDTNLCPDAAMPGITFAGGYAQYAVVPRAALIPIDAALSLVDAAAIPISFGTAWRMLVTLADVQPGETVLVNGAGGALGTAAVQVASLRGAETIASAGSPEKLTRARDLGATALVDYRESDLAEEVRRLTAQRGVDVALDHVGGSVLESTLQCMAHRGRIIVGGGHGGEVVSVDVVAFFRQELRLIGSRSQRREEIETVLRLAAQGDLKAEIGRILPLSEAAEAHALVRSRKAIGKVVLVP